MTTLSIRSMSRAEVDLAVEWAAREGWNPGLHDAAVFHACDPDGFLIAHMGTQPVAVCSAVRYGAHFGFVGFYIVEPSWRGQGHGLALWQAAMDRLKGRVVGLDGVVAQQQNYAKSGFVLAYRQVRHAGRARAAVPDAGLRPLSQIDRAHWMAYDRACFPAPREAFIAAWVSQPGTVALACVDSTGALQGYGAIRPCRVGYKVGPLFADDAGVADRLLRGLLSAVPEGAEVFLDAPQANPAALALAQRHTMVPVFETARMYAGGQVSIALLRQFGVTSFELG